MAAALVTDLAARLYEVCGNDMRIFHDLCRGGIEPIGILFSEFAGSPLPPAVIMQVLSMETLRFKALCGRARRGLEAAPGRGGRQRGR
jgi:hypothetical protein